ncbi:hypothetical protein OG588_01425 [Streptomyces prunicolor]|uniref:hypothetical protein n=1 Tax=Streptomyces prunicolor TaxID=67348 RepID=UPI00386DC733|nr:hypothetical protein OG588_01425 [Streptomyces prunicolor]
MTEYPGFDVLLARLANRRQLDVVDLSRSTGIPESALRSVFAGAVPEPPLLRGIAPALRLRAADLFVIAGMPVPDDLAPLDARAGSMAASLVPDAMRLPREDRRLLRRLVRSLPQEYRTQPVETPRAHEQFGWGPGGVLVRMVRNRNLSWGGTARTFLSLTGRYWAASTYGAVGHGRKELTSDLVADFSTVLDVPADTLSVLTGVDLPDVVLPPDPAAADVAELLWDVRRLTVEQVGQVGDTARSMLHG